MNHELLKLKNQLNTLLVHSPGATASTTQIWFRAGSALEGPNDHGIAHFLEHMFFKGTAKRPGAKIAHDVESFGGEINAFTSFDYTCYYINSPNKYLNNTIEILLDMVSNPLFGKDDLIPERNVVHEEYRRSVDSPGQFAFMNIQNHSFTGGYQHPILGSEDHIKNFSREQLLKFRENYYNTQNALLVIAGDLNNKEQLLKTVEKYQLPSGKVSSFPRFKLKNKSSTHAHSKDVTMVHLNMTLEAPTLQNELAPAEDLAFNCLGHGETSYFHRLLVLKDTLASSSSASTMFMNDGGAHFIKIVTPAKNLKKALDRLYTTLEELTRKGFAEEEVQRIKNQYIASKVYEMESLEAYAFSLGHSYAQSGTLTSEEQFIQRIKQCSLEDVNHGLRMALARAIHLHALVPKKESSAEVKKILQDFSLKLDRLSKKIAKPAQKGVSYEVSKFDPQVKFLTIKPGIKLLYRQNTMNPTFILHAYLKGGLTEEKAKTNGSFHLLSNLLTKGHRKASYVKLKNELENLSASFSGFTGKNAYGLTLHGQTDSFPILAGHFLNSLIAPRLEEKYLKHEKKMAQRILESQIADPVRTCFQSINEIFFAGHPYQQNVLGTQNSLKDISREGLLKLHQSKVQKDELLITYCGDLSLNDVLKNLSPYLNELKPRKEKSLKHKEIKKQKSQYKVIPFEREQTHIFYGIQIGNISSDDNLILKMLTTHLSGQSSELFVEVRDRQGLCYTAQPIHFNALEGGYWGIYMASGNEKVQPALAAIKKIIDNLSSQSLSKEEFERIKKMIEGQALINVQTNDDYANVYSIPLFQKLGLDYYHRSNENIMELKYESFKKKLSQLIARPWSTIIVGQD